MVAADAGLIKSGTSTLEAGLLGCPHAVVFKAGKVTQWIFEKLIRYRGPVGLVNIVAGYEAGKPYLVDEILCDEVTEARLTKEIVALLTDEDKRSAQKKGFKLLKERVTGKGKRESPSVVAAKELVEVYRQTHPESVS